MSLELEDMRAAVDKMSDEELAQVAMRMMAVSWVWAGSGYAVWCWQGAREQ
jgi:hypothetical protein